MALETYASPAPATAPVSTEEALAIGLEAYVYLYPLVTMEVTRRQMTNLPAGQKLGFGPMGAFSHARRFPPAGFKAVVRPNFDTLYSSAWLDLTHEPVVVSVPDTHGRFYCLPIYDMWTNAFAVPGARTSGTAAGHFAVVPPGWDGRLPDEVTPVRSPTRYVWVIGRTQTNGPSDYDFVNRIQDGMSITPLSHWGGEPPVVDVEVDDTVDMDTAPLETVNAMSAHDYFATGADLMLMHQPQLTDWSVLARMRRIGLDRGRFDPEVLPREVREALTGVPGQAFGLMHQTLVRMARVVNGWQMNTESMGVYGNSYLKRAIVAMIGLGALPAEDAIYPLAMSDADGRPLDGGHDYVLHFERDELPPVDAFWSVTMYDAEGFHAANELDRFAIGDRDPLHFNDDGSLDLYLQQTNPGPHRTSNWLPAPRGPLGVTMRLYAPHAQALDGRWTPPPITLTS